MVLIVGATSTCAPTHRRRRGSPQTCRLNQAIYPGSHGQGASQPAATKPASQPASQPASRPASQPASLHEYLEAIKQKWLASVHGITSGTDLAAYWWVSIMQTLRERIEQLHSDCTEALEPKQWRPPPHQHTLYMETRTKISIWPKWSIEPFVV